MSILLNDEELRIIKERVNNEYREMEWRKFLQIDRSVEVWAEDYKIITLDGIAPKPQLVSDPANRPGPNRLPVPRISRRETIGKVHRFALSYDWTDDEQRRYQKLGIQIATDKAGFNSQSFEEMLERVAANGASTEVETAGLFGDIGLTNIATGAADVLGATGQTAMLVSELPKVAGVGNQGWFDLSSGAATATAREMFRDMSNIVESVYYSTLNRNRCTDLVLAQALWKVASVTYDGVDTHKSALQMFREAYPQIQLRQWYRLDGAGAAGKHRIMAWDNTDPHAPKMVLPQEMTQSAPRETADGLGMLINQTIVCGGLLVKKPQLMVYCDITNQP